MQALYEITAYEIEEQDFISFVSTEVEDRETYITNEIMLVSVKVDDVRKNSIHIEGESYVTGDKVTYDLDPDFVVSFLGE